MGGAAPGRGGLQSDPSGSHRITVKKFAGVGRFVEGASASLRRKENQGLSSLLKDVKKMWAGECSFPKKSYSERLPRRDRPAGVSQKRPTIAQRLSDTF